jgi:hypothetical protein
MQCGSFNWQGQILSTFARILTMCYDRRQQVMQYMTWIFNDPVKKCLLQFSIGIFSESCLLGTETKSFTLSEKAFYAIFISFQKLTLTKRVKH